MATARAWDTPTNNRDGQAEVIAFLANAATHRGAAVECVETHISVVFLAGRDAYKLKRAVKFDYLDFSSPELRRRCCEEEVRLNRRTAPAIYKGVLPITRQASGALELNGTGEPIDWVVHMARFDQSQLLDRLAAARALPLSLMDELGRTIAAFHRDAARRADRGGSRGMQLVVDGNAAHLQHETLSLRTTAELARCHALLEGRRERGFVRECHGDLHLGNIVLIDDVPTLFDAIEFNDDIACADVLYDLAFLIMDLRHRALPAHANALWNAYLEDTGDYDGLALMPLFLSCRAAVRAKISDASSRVQHEAAVREALQYAGREYLAEALRLLDHRRPMVIAIGGVSGTGKSTVAAMLAPHVGGAPGAVILRSDVLRKQLCGVARFDRLGAAGYTGAVSARVYEELAARARRIAVATTVIVDATFLNESHRKLVETAAREAGADFHGFWLDAPDQVLLERLRARWRDPSDADATVLASQRRMDAGPLSWAHVDAEKAAPVEKILAAIPANDGISAIDPPD